MSIPLPQINVIQNMVHQAFPNRKLEAFEVLSGGLINTNLRIHFERSDSFVLRIYRDGAAACQKEVALHQLVQETVPVASIVHAEPDGIDGSSAFAILEYVDGLTFQQLKYTNDCDAIAEAASSVGQVLASIGRHKFLKPGQIVVDDQSGKLTIGKSFPTVPELVDSFLRSSVLQRRIDSKLIFKLLKFVEDWTPALEPFLDDRILVHCDFGSRNLLTSNRSGRWKVAAVLDWELAISGPSLLDVGHFLRYDYSTPLLEPHFATAFIEYGGRLPDDWQRLARVFDLTGLIECLTHQHLPEEVTAEILELIQATLRELT